MTLKDILPSKLGFGAAPLGNMFRDIPETEALATVNAAWDDGIRYFDNAPFYGAGLGAYDLLAGKLSLGQSQVMGREQTVNYLPNVEKRGLKGGILYFDGQFDDARLAVSLLRTLQDQNGLAANYAEQKDISDDTTPTARLASVTYTACPRR